MNSNRIVSALVILVLSTSSNLHAADLTYTYGAGDNELSVISKTVSGVTLTLLNPSARTTFRTDGDGLGVGLQGIFLSGAPLTSFQLQVAGGSLALKSYVLGYTDRSSAATFSMSGGSGTSTGNSLGSTGNFNASGNWILAPGDTGTLTASGFDTGSAGGIAQFASITFTVVPEPSTYALGVTAAGVMAFAARRRKSRIA